jgi:hypothetical protein
LRGKLELEVDTAAICFAGLKNCADSVHKFSRAFLLRYESVQFLTPAKQMELQFCRPAYGRLLKLKYFCKAARARLPGKSAGQGCRARLPGKAAGQGCRARLPGKAAGQSSRAKLPGKAVGQGGRA